MKKYKYTKTFTYDGERYFVRADTELELGRKYADKLREVESGKIKHGGNVRLGEWAHRCIDLYKTNVKQKTRARYIYFVEHYILEHIGNIELKKIDQITCQRLINSYEGKSKYLITQVYFMLNFLLDKAVINGLIPKNYAKGITRPRGTYEPRRALTLDEEAVFLRCAPKHQYGLYFMLMYACGCRPAESAAVIYRDIIMQDEKRYLHIRGTKTSAADRYVPMPDNVWQLVPKHLAPTDPLSKTGKGNSLDEQARKRAWKSLCRDMNIQMGARTYRNKLIPPLPLADDLTTYCLRHTYCTNLQRRGVDIRTAQYLMGHADIKMTANIYTHTTLETLAGSWESIAGSANSSDKSSQKHHLHR